MEMYKCDHCDGKGTIPVHLEGWSGICPKCMGTGNVDWVENVLWKDKRPRKDGLYCVIEVEKPYTIFEGNFVSVSNNGKIIPCSSTENSRNIFGVAERINHKTNTCEVLMNTNYGKLEIKYLQPEQN